MTAPMTPLDKALAWHELGKAWSPNAPSVQHVDAILAELERVRAERPAPDPALVERIRAALDFGVQRKAVAVPIDVEDVEQLLSLLDLQPAQSHLRQTGRARQETEGNV